MKLQGGYKDEKDQCRSLWSRCCVCKLCGTAGVPGVGLIMLAMVLNAVGLNAAAIGIILGIDRLLDMTRTSVNITGDAACALIVSESEQRKLNKRALPKQNANA